MPFELSRVVDILDSSDEAYALMASLVEARVNKSVELFIASLGRFSDAAKVDQVLELYGELEQAGQLRVLVSAEFGKVLNLMHRRHTHRRKHGHSKRFSISSPASMPYGVSTTEAKRTT